MLGSPIKTHDVTPIQKITGSCIPDYPDYSCSQFNSIRLLVIITELFTDTCIMYAPERKCFCKGHPCAGLGANNILKSVILITNLIDCLIIY